MKENNTPVEILIVRNYLTQFKPYSMDEPRENLIQKTSVDIQSDLSDMCDIDLTVIASEMIKAGYRIIITSDNKTAWALSPSK